MKFIKKITCRECYEMYNNICLVMMIHLMEYDDLNSSMNQFLQ